MAYKPNPHSKTAYERYLDENINDIPLPYREQLKAQRVYVDRPICLGFRLRVKYPQEFNRLYTAWLTVQKGKN